MVGGRLGQFAHNWSELTQDGFVLKTIREGYRIELASAVPLQRSVPEARGPATAEQRLALRNEVQALIAKKAVIQLSGPDLHSPGHYSHMFMRRKQSGAWRPILNLKRLNKSIVTKKFRMDTIQIVMDSLKVGEYVTSIDLKDAYFHVAIHPDDRKYLRFVVEGTPYQFQVLPFGLSTAPRVFTRVVKALISFLRKRGLKIFSYLDDWLLAHQDPEKLREHTELALVETEKAGFVINQSKSDLAPTLKPMYLGAELDMVRGLAHPSLERIQTLELFVRNLLEEGSAPALFWLQMLGRMASWKGLVPFSMLRMRLIQFCFQSQWNRTLPQSTEVSFPESLIPHLSWWLNRENSMKGVPFHRSEPSVVITTDASESGWGGHIDDLMVSGNWEPEVGSEHINMLELRAVFRTLKHFERVVYDRVVLVQTDNSTVVSYINRQGGTRSWSLCRLTLDLFDWCSTRKVQLRASHLPGKQNFLADDLSRGRVSPTEWSLHKGIVDTLFHSLGRPHVDLFANSQNAKLPSYCTRFRDPLAWATDAFSLSWKGMHSYAYPPISLIRKVLVKLESEPCRMLLIAPLWPRQHWFHQLVSLLEDSPRLLPEREDLLEQRGTWFPQPENLHLTAWPLSSVLSYRQDFLNRLPRWRPRPEERARFGYTIPEFVIGTNGAQQEVMIPIMPL